MVFFSFLLGQIASSLADRVLSVVESSSNLQQVLLPISVFQVVMILVLGLYVFIRRGFIDEKAIGIKECIGIGAIVAFFADSISSAPQIIAAVRGTNEPIITATTFLLYFLIDTAVASIIALSFRVHLRNRSAAWILILIAILSAGIAALSQQVIAIHTTEINQSISHLSSTSILHSFPNIILNDIFNNYYATSAPTYPISISIAWFLGFSVVFGCLLGFLFGFRSAFSDKQASVTSSLPTAKLRVAGTSSRSIRIFSRRTAMIVFAGLAVAVVGGNLLWWTLLHRPYTYHSDSSSLGNITWGNITWSLDGKLIAFTTSSDLGQKQSTSTLRVWEFATNENLSIYSNSSSSVESSIWSRDGKYLAFTTSTVSGGSSTSTVQTSTVQVWVWDALTKAKVSLYTYTYTGSGSPYADITWSPDSKYLAFTTSTYPGGSSTSPVQKGTAQVGVWDALTKAKVSLYTYTYPDSSYENINTDWSRDSKYLAFTISTNPGGSSTNTVQKGTVQVWVWDAITKAKVSLYTSTYPGSSYANINIYWSPDGKYLAFTTSTNPEGSSTRTVQVWVWDALTKARLSIYTSTGSSSSDASDAEITWSHDGKYLAFITYTVPGGSSTSTVQKGTVQVWVWDAITKANLFIYTYPYTTTGSSPVGGSGIYFGSGSPSYPDITWSTDDKHLAFVINRIDPSCETTSNSCNGTVHIWDATTKGSTYVLRLGSSAVEIIAWSPDNARIASGSSDGTLYVWYAV